MADLEQRARALLADECEACGAHASAKAIRFGNSEDFFVGKAVSLRALIKALSREAELEEALRPFAESAENVSVHEEGIKIVAHVPAGPHARQFGIISKLLTADNFRKARSALHGERGEG